MENYRRAIDSGNGAILMGVLRGKVKYFEPIKEMYIPNYDYQVLHMIFYNRFPKVWILRINIVVVYS